MSENKNILNGEFHYPTSQIYETGGKRKEWNVLIRRGQNYEQFIPTIGNVMEDLKQRLKTIKRTDVPMFLDPKTATFLDVAIHAMVRQFLSESTIEKHLRYARFMELHPMAVDFKNLTPESFLRHMDYRLSMEDPPATPNALKHEKRALLMFLRAFKQYNEDWKEYIKTPPVIENEDNTVVPFPSQVNLLYKSKYSDDKYENVMIQTVVFTGFNFGMRPPSKICNLNMEDLVVNSDGTGYIRIHEDKKRKKNRLIYPYNKNVLSSNVFKTPGNYVKKWRCKVENEYSGNAMFLKPDGTRITGSYLRDKISPIFKQVLREPSAHLYTMRHTFATYLYEYTNNIKLVAKKLGHKGSSNVDKYIHIADSIKEQSGRRNLFNQALRSIKLRGKPGKIDCWKKWHQSTKFSPGNISGPARI